jgi:uncharacterized protein YndB with AHSA1/START domain
MTAEYRRTFVVAVPVTKAWLAFAEPQQREAWMGTPPLDQFEPVEIKIGTVEPLRRMSWSQSHAGLDGWHETTVTFEEVSSGTRITIVRSGFGETEGWRHFASNTGRGWDEMIADLILYLETGVRGERHFSFRSGLGATMLEAGPGVRITHVVPGGFATKVGMQAGDVLLRLNGASVVRLTDVAFVTREHAPGEEVEAEYVHGSAILRGRAPLSEWNYGDGRYVGHPGGYPKPTLTGAQGGPA